MSRSAPFFFSSSCLLSPALPDSPIHTRTATHAYLGRRDSALARSAATDTERAYIGAIWVLRQQRSDRLTTSRSTQRGLVVYLNGYWVVPLSLSPSRSLSFSSRLPSFLPSALTRFSVRSRVFCLTSCCCCCCCSYCSRGRGV